MKPQHPDRTPPAKISRRHALAGGAITAASGLSIVGAVIPITTPSAEAVLLALLQHRQAAGEVGNAVLASWPHVRDRAQLLSDMLGDLRLDKDTLSHSDMTDIATRLSQLIRDDFATGRTLKLDGWLVSLTESRLCALAALKEA